MSKGRHWKRLCSLPKYSFLKDINDDDGQRHSAKLAWRALALLQLELEAEKGKEYYER